MLKFILNDLVLAPLPIFSQPFFCSSSSGCIEDEPAFLNLREIPKFNPGRRTQRVSTCQCDQIGRFIALWARGNNNVAQITHILGIFCWGVKIFYFLVESFLGNFYGHLLTLYWSRWYLLMSWGSVKLWWLNLKVTRWQDIWSLTAMKIAQ